MAAPRRQNCVRPDIVPKCRLQSGAGSKCGAGKREVYERPPSEIVRMSATRLTAGDRFVSLHAKAQRRGRRELLCSGTANAKAKVSMAEMECRTGLRCSACCKARADIDRTRRPRRRAMSSICRGHGSGHILCRPADLKASPTSKQPIWRASARTACQLSCGKMPRSPVAFCQCGTRRASPAPGDAWDAPQRQHSILLNQLTLCRHRRIIDAERIGGWIEIAP